MRCSAVAAFGAGAVLLGGLLLQGGCLHAGSRAGAEPPDSPRAQGALEAQRAQAVEETLALLEQGRGEEARRVMEAAGVAGNATGAQGPCPEAFGLAAALLAGQTDLDGLTFFRETFRLYAERFPPESEGRKRADRVVRLLDGRIREAQKGLESARVLRRRLAEQGAALKDLEYKLRKLEEIQQETENRREDFLHR